MSDIVTDNYSVINAIENRHGMIKEKEETVSYSWKSWDRGETGELYIW